MRVVFIGGASRSGSTLLDRMLGAEEGVASLGEVHHVWQRGLLENHHCGCGERFLACPAWREIRHQIGALTDPETFARTALALQREVIRSRRIPSMALRLRREQPLTDAEATYAALLDSLFAAASDVLAAPVIVDSSKRAAHGYLLASTPGLDLGLVHLVRDSRATAFSTAKTKAKSDSGTTEQMKTYTPMTSARTWVQANALTEALARHCPRAIRMSYEDLARSPAEELRRVGPHIDVSMQLAWLDGSKAAFSPAHTISGNPMRMQRGSVAISLDDRWRTGLPRRDQWLVTSVTAPWLLKYGYGLN